MNSLKFLCLLSFLLFSSLSNYFVLGRRFAPQVEEYLKKRPFLLEHSIPDPLPSSVLFPPPSFQHAQENNLTHLNIHVIAHTHDDVGWLKTVDEYYVGLNQSIQDAGVQYVLDTVIQSLLENPQRKFIYVEIGFFSRWWNEQDSATQDIVRGLVNNGQLEFINGGWCMSDEANEYYEDSIIQMTTGHAFLLENFGIVPKIGWQIDPFGHASNQVTTFAEIGFEAMFFARIDYQDYQYRTQTNVRDLEFIWEGSRSLPNTGLFTHVLWDTTYCFPPDFAFEWGDDPIQNDPRLFNMNVQQKADEFAAQMRQRASIYRSGEILVTFGCDFMFMNANQEFKNMDKLMAYINANPERYNLTVFYSTPSIYVEAVNTYNITWNVKTDDFFPYADNSFSYWTGYFTSRSALKGYVRSMSNVLSSAEKLLATAWLPGNTTDLEDSLLNLREAHSVAQHHDAVAGTEKQHVADDYAERLSIGWNVTQEATSQILSYLVSGGAGVSFSNCPYLNISQCPSVTDPLSSGLSVPVIIYNPIAWDRTEYISLPVPSANVEVVDEGGKLVKSQLYTNEDNDQMYTLTFLASIPAVGFTTYFVQPNSSATYVVEESTVGNGQGNFTIENDYLVLTFDGATNLIASVFNKQTNQTLSVSQSYFYYNGSIGNAASGQASGAYIFRPNSSSVTPVNQQPPSVTVYEGSLVQEVRQVFSDWVQQVFRLYQGNTFVEVEATVGPIPIDDHVGKEVITRYSTDLNTDSTWYTDSQGLEMQKRVLNYRPTWNLTVVQPVAGNYYPCNSHSFINDQTKNLQLTLVGDRARGVSSLANGQLEEMYHRRLLVDDGRGVGEPLNETTTIRTYNNLIVDDIANSPSQYRIRNILLNHPVILNFGSGVQNPKDWFSKYNTTFNPVANPLPPNVHLLTFALQPDGLILVRLMHIFEVGEDSSLSNQVTVDLSTLFKNISPIDLQETQLTAVEPIDDVHTLSWQTTNGMKSSTPRKPQQPTDFIIVLSPMEIRTFLVRYTTY